MLSDRKEAILQFLVGQYIAEGAPVSSEQIARQVGVGASPATVRNDMADLEEEGYIHRPHASAGGIPADRAYRLYVESLGEPPEPPAAVREALRTRVGQTLPGMGAWVRVAVETLAGLVRQMTIATPVRAAESRWQHLELVYLQEFLALLIIVLQGAQLKEHLLPLKEGASQAELTRIANKLNDTFAGLTPREMESRMAELTPLEEAVADTAHAILRAEQELRLQEHYVVGLRHILGHPDLADAHGARTVAELVEEGLLLRSMLTTMPPPRGVRVIIGGENTEAQLRPYSIVVAQYGVPGEAWGVVGAVGPMRMEYSMVMAHVRYTSSLLTELVEGVHGRTS